MRIECALLTHPRAKLWMSRQPHLKYSPIVAVDRDPSGVRSAVMNWFPGATDGMSLEQAVPHHANVVGPYKLGVSGSNGESGTQIGLTRGVQGDRRRRFTEAGRDCGVELPPRSPWGRRGYALRMPIGPSRRQIMMPLYTQKPVEIREGTKGEWASVRAEGHCQRLDHNDDMWTFHLW